MVEEATPVFTLLNVKPDPALAALLGDIVRPGAGELKDDWSPALVQWAANMGLASALWNRCAAGRLQIPGSVHDELRAAALAQAVLGRTQRAELLRIEAALNSADIRVLRLKGAAIQECYPQPSDRSMSDLDLLLSKLQMNAAHEVMTQLGYAQESSRSHAFYSGHHHVMPYKHPKLRTCIELHHGLIEPGDPAAALSEAALFADAASGSARTLSREAQILHTVLHMTTMLDPKACITGIIDLGVLSSLAGPPLDWPRIEQWASSALLRNRFLAAAIGQSVLRAGGADLLRVAAPVSGRSLQARALAATWNASVFAPSSPRRVERWSLLWNAMLKPGPRWRSWQSWLRAWLIRGLQSAGQRFRQGKNKPPRLR